MTDEMKMVALALKVAEDKTRVRGIAALVGLTAAVGTVAGWLTNGPRWLILVTPVLLFVAALTAEHWAFWRNIRNVLEEKFNGGK